MIASFRASMHIHIETQSDRALRQACFIGLSGLAYRVFDDACNTSNGQTGMLHARFPVAYDRRA
jgi:hypothetical protein